MGSNLVAVPSQWHHQVHNLDDAISINHNWSNAHNLDMMGQFLASDYHSLRSSILELRETFGDASAFEEQCQVMLSANAGLNFKSFDTYLRKATRSISTQSPNLRKLNRTLLRRAVEQLATLPTFPAASTPVVLFNSVAM